MLPTPYTLCALFILSSVVEAAEGASNTLEAQEDHNLVILRNKPMPELGGGVWQRF